MTAADDRKVTTAPDVSVHKPFTDEGVTYCGWYAGPGTRVVDGCGQVWPCETVQARRNNRARPGASMVDFLPGGGLGDGL